MPPERKRKRSRKQNPRGRLPGPRRLSSQDPDEELNAEQGQASAAEEFDHEAQERASDISIPPRTIQASSLHHVSDITDASANHISSNGPLGLAGSSTDLDSFDSRFEADWETHGLNSLNANLSLGSEPKEFHLARPPASREESRDGYLTSYFAPLWEEGSGTNYGPASSQGIPQDGSRPVQPVSASISAAVKAVPKPK